MEPDQAAGLLVAVLAKETDPSARAALVEGLSALAGRMDPHQAAKVADFLVALAQKTNYPAGWGLAAILSSLAARMEPTQAATVCAQGADILLAALTKEPISQDCADLVMGLSSLAARLEPQQAAKVCARGADILVAAVAKETGDSFGRANVSAVLSSLAARLEPIRRRRSRTA